MRTLSRLFAHFLKEARTNPSTRRQIGIDRGFAFPPQASQASGAAVPGRSDCALSLPFRVRARNLRSARTTSDSRYDSNGVKQSIFNPSIDEHPPTIAVSFSRH